MSISELYKRSFETRFALSPSQLLANLVAEPTLALVLHRQRHLKLAAATKF